MFKNVFSLVLMGLALATTVLAQPGEVISEYKKTQHGEHVFTGVTLFDTYGVEHRVILLKNAQANFINRYSAVYPSGNGSTQTLEQDYERGLLTFMDMIIWKNEAFVLAFQELDGDKLLRVDRYKYDSSVGSISTHTDQVMIVDTDNDNLLNDYNYMHQLGELAVAEGKLVARVYAQRKLDGDLRMIHATK